MKIAAVQLQPFTGDIAKNIEKHLQFIEQAAASGAELVFFPELSLTAYEPKLAEALATTSDDLRFELFQNISVEKQITIGVGAPTHTEGEVRISTLWFQPAHTPRTYSKQLLHADEFPYFKNGKEQLILTVADKKLFPAICYESLQPEHAEKAFQAKADVYLASVAKNINGMNKANKHYPEAARQYGMTVMMANSIGFCDDFTSVGQSSVWNTKGELIGQLNADQEGILIYDTTTGEVIIKQ